MTLVAHSGPGGPAEHPARASGVVLHGPMAGSGYTDPPLLAGRGDGQMVQLTPLLYTVLDALDGQRDWEGLARVVGERVLRPVTAADVRYLVEHKLRPAGLVTLPDGSQPVISKRNPLLGLRGRLVLADPDRTGRLVAPLTPLFSRWAAVPVLVAFAAVVWWVLARQGLGGAVDDAMQDPVMLLVVIGGTILSAAFHELGHAAACRASGARPGAIGAAVYLVWPVFYTDVTDAYRLDRWGRLRVDLAGIYFNAVFTLGAFGLWAATGWEALLVLVPVQVFQMLRQLIPVVRFDGYHILADLTGVPDLFARIGPTLLGLVGKGDGSHRRLKPWARAVVVGWVLLVVPALGFVFALALVNLPEIFGTSIDSLVLHGRALAANAAAGDVPRVLLGVVAMVTIALIPLGLAYVLARVTTRSAAGLWSATEGHPALRGVGGTAVLALVAATLMSWMPAPRLAGPDLVAVAAGEAKAAVADARASAVERAASPPVEPANETTSVHVTGPDPRPVAVAAVQPARTVAKPPTAERQSSAALLVASVDDWPFPFDPPEEARPGDNVVVAVNTVDGTSVYEYAAELTWLEDTDLLDERNRAVALASCRDCATRAVAMHVVVSVGSPDIVVPENSAVALNYECESCATDAVAVQLVLTLEEAPAPEVVAQVEALWAELEAAQAAFETAPVAEVHGQLTSVREQILALLVQDDGAVADGQFAELDPTSATASLNRRPATAPAVDTGPVREPEAVPTGDPVAPVARADRATDEPTPAAPVAAALPVDPVPEQPAPVDDPQPDPPAPDDPVRDGAGLRRPADPLLPRDAGAGERVSA